MPTLVLTPVATPTPPVVEPSREELAQGIAPNIDNLLVTRRPVNVAEKPTIFVIRVEVKDLGQREKERASSTAVCLTLWLPYLVS